MAETEAQRRELQSFRGITKTYLFLGQRRIGSLSSWLKIEKV